MKTFFQTVVEYVRPLGHSVQRQGDLIEIWGKNARIAAIIHPNGTINYRSRSRKLSDRLQTAVKVAIAANLKGTLMEGGAAALPSKTRFYIITGYAALRLAKQRKLTLYATTNGWSGIAVDAKHADMADMAVLAVLDISPLHLHVRVKHTGEWFSRAENKTSKARGLALELELHFGSHGEYIDENKYGLEPVWEDV